MEKVLAPLALKTSGGWVPLVVGQVEEDLYSIIFFLACFTSSNGAAFNKGACYDDALCPRVSAKFADTRIHKGHHRSTRLYKTRLRDKM